MSGDGSTAPSATDYLGAIQHPRQAFTVAELQSAVFQQGVLGPKAAKGKNAVVVRATIAGQDEALRFFLRPSPGGALRYRAIGPYARFHGLSAVARADLVADAISIKGTLWPVLRMEWVEGRPLDKYVGWLASRNDRGSLAALADAWRDLVRQLQEVRFAHGDLQHGNIMLDASSHLRLVDLDSVWIPALADEAPRELGHPNFQHPARGSRGRWNEWVDSFPALVIYLALRVLAARPGMWVELANDDNLLFRAQDFLPPFETVIWTKIAEIADHDVNRVAAVLRQCCQPDWSGSATLEVLLKPETILVPPVLGGVTPAAGTGPIDDWWKGLAGDPVHQQGVEGNTCEVTGLPLRSTDLPWPMALAAPVLPPPPPASSDTSPVSPPLAVVQISEWWAPTQPRGPGAANIPSAAPPRPPTATATSSRRKRRWVLVVVLLLLLALAAWIAYVVATKNRATPSAAAATTVPPTTVTTATTLPPILPATDLLPASVVQSSCAPINGTITGMVGTTTSLGCTSAAGLNGKVFVYQFDGSSDYSTSLDAFNVYQNFNPATAGASCPAATASGQQAWSSGEFPPLPGQFVECMGNVDTTYVWTYPTENAFLIAGNQSSSSAPNLDSWLRDNGIVFGS